MGSGELEDIESGDSDTREYGTSYDNEDDENEDDENENEDDGNEDGFYEGEYHEDSGYFINTGPDKEKIGIFNGLVITNDRRSILKKYTSRYD